MDFKWSSIFTFNRYHYVRIFPHNIDHVHELLHVINKIWRSYCILNLSIFIDCLDLSCVCIVVFMFLTSIQFQWDIVDSKVTIKFCICNKITNKFVFYVLFSIQKLKMWTLMHYWVTYAKWNRVLMSSQIQTMMTHRTQTALFLCFLAIQIWASRHLRRLQLLNLNLQNHRVRLLERCLRHLPLHLQKVRH